MSPDKIKHLEFILNVISRMNTNSFMIKGWSIFITSALLAVYASTKNNYFFLAAVFPTLICWFLDAYYLNQGRKFKGLYNYVAGVTDEPKEIKLFAMRTDLYVGGRYSYFSAFRSVTLIMYLAMIVTLLGIFYYFEYSLKEITREDKTSRTNGVVGVIMKHNNGYSWLVSTETKDDGCPV